MTRGRKSIEDVLVEVQLREDGDKGWVFSGSSPATLADERTFVSVQVLFELAKMNLRSGEKYLVTIERMTETADCPVCGSKNIELDGEGNLHEHHDASGAAVCPGELPGVV